MSRQCCCRSQARSWEIQTELSQKPRTALSLLLKPGLMLALRAQEQGYVLTCHVCARVLWRVHGSVSVSRAPTHTQTSSCILGERSLLVPLLHLPFAFKEAQPTAKQTKEPYTSLPPTEARRETRYQSRAWLYRGPAECGPGALHHAHRALCARFFVLGLHPLLGASDMSAHLRNAGAVSPLSGR